MVELKRRAAIAFVLLLHAAVVVLVLLATYYFVRWVLWLYGPTGWIALAMAVMTAATIGLWSLVVRDDRRALEDVAREVTKR